MFEKDRVLRMCDSNLHTNAHIFYDMEGKYKKDIVTGSFSAVYRNKSRSVH